jgi:hypothetical protein
LFLVISIKVRVGFFSKFLNIDSEQALAWSIDPSTPICVDISFPLDYWNCFENWSTAVNVRVGQPVNIRTAWSTLTDIKLSYTMGQLIKTKFFPDLLHRKNPGRDVSGDDLPGEDIHERKYSVEDLKTLYELFGKGSPGLPQMPLAAIFSAFQEKSFDRADTQRYLRDAKNIPRHMQETKEAKRINELVAPK